MAFVSLVALIHLLRLTWAALLPGGEFDLQRIYNLIMGRRVFEAIINTLIIAFSSTALALLIGVTSALLVALTDMRAKSFWIFGLVIPLMIPPQVAAYAWLMAFSPSSPILGVFGYSLQAGTRHPFYSIGGIIFLLGLTSAPLVFLTVRASLRSLPGDLVEAARAFGASPLQLLFTTILPLVRASIFAGAALAFVNSVGNFGIQAMLGIPARVSTIMTLIYRKINSYGPSALNDMAVLSLMMAALIVVALMLSSWLGRKTDQSIVGYARPLSLKLGAWRLPIEVLAWGFLLLTLVLPLSSLLATSLVQSLGVTLTFKTFTFEYYYKALIEIKAIRKAFLFSFSISLATVLILAVITVIMGYFVVWKKGIIARFLQLASELSFALPGLIIGVAMILTFLRPLPIISVSIYGTFWIILIAYFSNYLALAMRPILGGFEQLDRGLDEAAQIFGAGFLTRLRDIIFPMIAPAAFAGAILVFMTAFNEIQTSVLLVSSRAQTIGPKIIGLEETGSTTVGAAVGALMVLSVLFLMIISSLFSHKLPKGVLPWSN